MEVSNIDTKSIGKRYDIGISSGDETASAYHGPFGYARWAITSSANENLRYLMTSAYDYGQAAKPQRRTSPMSPQTIKPRNMKEALMKEAYEILDMDAVAFDTDDVITTGCSGFTQGENETGFGG